MLDFGCEPVKINQVDSTRLTMNLGNEGGTEKTEGTARPRENPRHKWLYDNRGMRTRTKDYTHNVGIANRTPVKEHVAEQQETSNSF